MRGVCANIKQQRLEMRELTEINGFAPGLLVYWFVVCELRARLGSGGGFETTLC